MVFPKKIKELTWTKVADNYILVDPKTKKTYNIDTISFLIWVQCDGETSIDDMVDIFSVNGNRDIVKAAIRGILDKLEDSGLIKNSS